MAARLPIYELTVFQDDDTTELFDVSTDPGHARPYLKAPTGFPEQEINFAKGSASIGQVNVEIVDVRTVATDQDTGYLTGQLADGAGFSQINGHRAVLTEDVGSGPARILDGVIRGIQLLDNFVTYGLELRDIRERERKTKAFTNTTTSTIFPRGVLDGYGASLTIPFFGNTLWFPIAPTLPLRATYEQVTANRGHFRFEIQPDFNRLLWLSPKQKEVIDSVATSVIGGVDRPDILEHDRWQVLWRDTAGGGAYSTITRVAHTHPDLPEGSIEFPPYLVHLNRVHVFRINNEITGDTLPADTQAVDFILQYTGPPTEDWPHHITGVTVGELLRNLYRGDHSDEDPRIRFNEAALLALATPCRARITAPVDDLRAWAEKNAYPIVHAAPTLNGDGEIAPITFVLPDASETLIDLSNTNCRPVGGGWSHRDEDAVNLVKVKYRREFRRTPETQVSEQTPGDMVEVREIEIERRIQDSIDLLGEQPLEIDSVLLTAVGSGDGQALLPDVREETGFLVAQRAVHMATDRFALGGQYFALLCDRSDTDVEALLPGSFVTVSVSWMPDYVSLERGLSRLAQVISRRNRDAAWVELTLLDSGSDAAPVGQPTLGVITAATNGVVTIPISAVAAGSEARVEFAVSTLEPAADSELWTFLGRATSGDLLTPPNPQGVTVWVRARGEATGRRPSVYITAVSVVITGVPRIVDVVILLDDAGFPTVEWIPNAATLGVRIFYDRHDIDVAPVFVGPNLVDVNAADGSYAFPEESPFPILEGSTFSVQLEPWTGWTPPNVSGSSGPRFSTQVHGNLRPSDVGVDFPPFENLELYLPLDEGAGQTLRDRSTHGRDAAPWATTPVPISWLRGVKGWSVDLPGGAFIGPRLLTDAQAGAIEALFYVACWIKVDTVAGDARAVIVSRDPGKYFEVALEQDEAFPQDIRFDYSETQEVTLDDLITSGEWHFLLAQWDVAATTVELWHGVEGSALSRVFRTEAFAGFSVDSRDLRLGSNQQAAPTAVRNFDGQVDDLRIGTGFLSHAQIKSLFDFPGNDVHVTDVARPEVEVHTDQSALVGTLNLVVHDPSEVVTATAFEPIAGAGDFDLTTDPSTWAVFDTVSPYVLTDTVTISTKHTSRIGWAVRYTNEDGLTVWIRGIATFDPDEIAELTGHEIGFEDDGTVVINWDGDEDWVEGYVTVGITSAPADPTAATNDGDLTGQHGSLILDGLGSTNLRQAVIGDNVFVKVLPQTGAPVAGTFRRRRGDTEFVPPRIEVNFDRDAQGDGELQLIITDPSGAISVSPEFSERAGSQAGDTWGAFSSVWDTEPGGQPPFAGTWLQAITVPDGEEVAMRWRVTFIDEQGDTQVLGDTVYTARVDELTTTVYYSFNQATENIATSQAANYASGYLHPVDTSAHAFLMVVVLPAGVTITDYAARMYRQAVGDNATFTLRRITNTGAFLTLGSTRTHSTTGWATLADSGPNYTVGAEEQIQGVIGLTGTTIGADARFQYLSITFVRHTYAEEL